MKIGKSRKSGKINYINSHHIIPLRIKDNSTTLVDLTLNEHAEIHSLIDGINDKNSILSIWYIWFTNKIIKI